MRKFLISILIVVLLIWASSCFFSVDWTEYVYLTQFGKPIDTFDGETDAGLHYKWPWPIQSVQKFDRRLHILDLPATELVTQDPKGKTIDRTLTISAYACWRIGSKGDVDRFIRTVGTPDRAETILSQRINSQLGSEVSNMKLDELIKDTAASQAEDSLDQLSRRLLDGSDSDKAIGTSLRQVARETYGIELVDVRLRRFNYPAQVREAIYERIRSERNRKATEYQSEGDRIAKGIQSEAELQARNIITEAKAKEQRVRGQAEAEADRIRNEAQSKDPAFYAFLKKLEEYHRILGDNKSVLLLSSHRELFDLLFKPPAPGASSAAMQNAVAGPVPPKQSQKNGKQ
jgi:membrane protease subunit HflC